ALLVRAQAGIDELIGKTQLHRVEHVQGGVHDLGADAIAPDHRDGLAHRSDLVWFGRRGRYSRAGSRALSATGAPPVQATRFHSGAWPAAVQPPCGCGGVPDGAPPASSWSRKSTARRRCGITMLPPTTSATLKVSKNSSR